MKIKVNFRILYFLGYSWYQVWLQPALAQILRYWDSVKIASVDSTNLPAGDLTIYGTSSDDDTTNCRFMLTERSKPMQNVSANGP